MSAQAMLPCLVCGVELDNSFHDSTNQPSEGTEFRTYGHYGSTFWDSFSGEELVLNVCDECLRTHAERLAMHKRYRNLRCEGFIVGREWLDREMVPYRLIPEDDDTFDLEPDEVGTWNAGGRVEWVKDLDSIKDLIARVLAAAPVGDGEPE